jgi:predicted metal-dependent phosphoesterase TrpH
VLTEAGAGAVGRPHVGAVLVRKGVVASIDEAFERWLAKGRPGYVGRERLGAAEALTAAGLHGLECEHARSMPAERATYRAVARRHGLVPTGGSDYHGAYKPDLRVGVGRGDLAVPDDVVAELERRRR